MWLKKENSKDHNANKIDNCNRGKRRLKKKKNKKQKKQVKYKNSKYFSWVTVVSDLSLSGSHGPPFLPRMPSNTMLISGHAMGLARTLIRSYFSVFLPPMSTGVRASALSFVGLSVTFYIFQSQICLVDPVGSTFHLHSWWEGLALLP